jgi:hypothetical protein
MFRSSWILGLGAALLVACGVETSSVSSQTSATDDVQTSSESTISSELEALPGDVQPAAVCTPGDDRLCCPFTQGCSCLGDQICNANGQWGACFGAGRRGQPCP